MTIKRVMFKSYIGLVLFGGFGQPEDMVLTVPLNIVVVHVPSSVNRSLFLTCCQYVISYIHRKTHKNTKQQAGMFLSLSDDIFRKTLCVALETCIRVYPNDVFWCFKNKMQLIYLTLTYSHVYVYNNGDNVSVNTQCIYINTLYI